MDFGLGGAEVLQQAKVGFAFRVESHEFAVEDGFVGRSLKSRGDVVKFLIEDITAAGVRRGRAVFFDGFEAKAVEFDLVASFGALG